MAVPNKIKKFFGKCKKPFICISKITKISKKNKKETIAPSPITNPIKEEIITKEIKLYPIQGNENTKVTLPESKFISTKEKPFYQFDTKPQIPIQPQPQPQQQPQQQHPNHKQIHQQNHHPHHLPLPKNHYKRYSINNIFNKPKFSPVTPSFVHPVAIKLNVGGITYMTTQQTLCTYPSYLSELFFIFRSPNLPPSLNHPQYPWPEELFIDRDGELFKYILSFLRTGTLPNSIPLSILQKLDYEASFYGIKPLQTLISHRVQIHTSSPKYKVIPIERLSNDDTDFDDGEENINNINSININVPSNITNGINMRRSNSSSYSISSLPQRNRINSDNISLNSLNSNSSANSSEIVPIIYNPNPCNTTSTSASRTPTTSYTPVTRTPKSSTSTHNNFYVSSAASQNCDYKPEYEIISITKIPIILKDNNYTFDNFDKINYLYDEEFHTKELATFVVLQRKDE